MNPELIRDLLNLLATASKNTFLDIIMSYPVVNVKGYGRDEVYRHCLLLADSGLIELQDASTKDGDDLFVRRVTIKGHEFLANTKDKSVWDTAVELAKQIGGVSLPIFVDVLKAVIKNRLGI